MLENIVQGDMLSVFVNIESREYNSRWYTDIRAWRIDRDAEEGVSSGTAEAEIPELDSPEDDLPF
jgi:hypothetical protein